MSHPLDGFFDSVDAPFMVEQFASVHKAFLKFPFLYIFIDLAALGSLGEYGATNRAFMAELALIRAYYTAFTNELILILLSFRGIL